MATSIMMSLEATVSGSFALYRDDRKTKLWGGGGDRLEGKDVTAICMI
jgi:hypothetical protein